MFRPPTMQEEEYRRLREMYFGPMRRSIEESMGAPKPRTTVPERMNEARQATESVYYGDGDWLEVDLGITGWGSRPYPQFYLNTMLTCNAKWNESHFCDEEFDALVALAGTTMNEADRVEAYNQIQELLIVRGPIMIPYFFSQLGAISDRFADFQMKPFPGRSDLSTVRLAGQ